MIALIADVHLGFSNRTRDILWALGVVRDHCVKQGVDTIIILGDLFHDRSVVSIEVFNAAYDFFKDSRDIFGLTWVVLPGNHDMFLKHSWKISSIRPLGEVLTVVDTVKILEIDDTRYWVLPFIHSEPAYMRVLEKIEKQYQPGDILLTHIGVSDSIKNICFLLQKWSLVSFANSKFTRVYTGHYHIHQQVGHNVWYVGSLIPFKFDEGDSDHGMFYVDAHQQKFVSIWEAAKDLKRESQPAPQFCTFHESLLDGKTDDEVRGNLIRISTTRDYTPQECHDIRHRLIDMGAIKVTFINLDKETLAETGQESVEPVKMEDLFQDWYDSDTKGTVGLRRNLALRLNREIVAEGDEIYANSKSVEP